MDAAGDCQPATTLASPALGRPITTADSARSELKKLDCNANVCPIIISQSPLETASAATDHA
jgi:hypothetical protein